jgi:hypothetical protein
MRRQSNGHLCQTSAIGAATNNNRKGNANVETLVKFIVLTVLLWVAVTWLLAPMFPQWVPYLTIFGCAGAAAIILILSLLFGK